jgi:hypothetical protein
MVRNLEHAPSGIRCSTDCKIISSPQLRLVWLPSFGVGIKEFIYDSSKYLFGCHGIGYGIHFEFHGFSFHA